MYNHNKIEKKWQKYWKENDTFAFVDDHNKPKFYILDMFPYPSGKGIHVGHLKGYVPTDVISRYHRLNGYNVLHPMGWDAFGLPAEQYALDTNNHPNEFTQKNIEVFRKQLQSVGFDYDYKKEVDTTSPDFYKWTQWIFVQLYKHNLAEIQEIDVNWCEKLGTVLSNEEVLVDANGNRVSERGSHPVVKKPMKQWVLKIVDYADKLLEGLNDIDFPESIKLLQTNWIGKSEGVNLDFKVADQDLNLTVFTTRIDTIYAVSYLVISPEHPLVASLTKQEYKEAVEQYVSKAKLSSDLDRIAKVDKTGVFSGSYVINPFTKELIPVWISDYVLMSFATGIVMGAPAHDERDFAFASKYNLAIKSIIQTNQPLPYLNDGKHINSELINGLNIADSIAKLSAYIVENNLGKVTQNYKLRNWIFSRQRYWGEPFPVLFNEQNEIAIIEDLPVQLPDLDDFKPSGTGESPLANATEWLYVMIDNKKYRRETNTMPQWAGSSWYFLAYILKNRDGTYTPLNSAEAYDRFSRWMPVDLYIGGQEHAVLHLLYSRFWYQFLYDIKAVPNKEPFFKVINQGMILAANNEKMSKSKGNVINPDDLVQSHGADALRLYMVFMGPITATLPWNNDGIDGMRKWLDRVHRLYMNLNDLKVVDNVDQLDQEIIYAYHKLIHNYKKAMKEYALNIAISEMMVFINVMYKHKVVNYELLDNFLILLSCFSPHLAEELYSINHNTSVCLATFPSYDESKLQLDTVTIPIQINGKLKHTINVQRDLDQEQLLKLVLEDEVIKNIINNQPIKKQVVVINKIVNLVI
ncbi:leucyl-tRNA synthetase [Ureaplasma diversum]|uniref:Leucine--tRNA ligase n=1 Tax=Ureaplasma diversum TaxID=42094 RepID=A0A0C5RPZ7_9BACT|nr:leucine--tRNA ligase [Ureaplasma diversum]AJQ45449.1 leucyl-tRNA synthetase [Ureaplasma diversum]